MPESPVSTQPIPLSRPDIGRLEIEAVLETLQDPHLSMGPRLASFERAFAQQTGRQHAVAVSSGTAGLHLCVHALGLKQGDQVVTTPFSFIASSNCLLFENVTPVFADIDPQTWNVSPDEVEAKITDRTRGLLAVHVFGRMQSILELEQIATKHQLLLVEDSCEALGSTIDGRPAGSFGRASVFGFYPNKQITTGEGGMILTDDSQLDAQLRSLRNQGRSTSSDWLAHERLGWNYRIPDILCALGTAQLSRLSEIMSARQNVYDLYSERLERIEEIDTPPPPAANETISWFVYVICLREGTNASHARRDAILQQLRQRGIGCRNYFTPIHLQPFYRERFGLGPGMFPVTESVAARTIALPFFNTLSHEEVDRVGTALEQSLDATRDVT